MNPILEMSKQVACPKCGGIMGRITGAEKQGDRSEVACPHCGWSGTAEVVSERLEVFEWGFDGGARTVIWNVAKMRRFLLKHAEKIPVHEVPWMLAEKWLEMNDFSPTDADPPSVAGDTPLIVIEHPSAIAEVREHFGLLPIDGWHRMFDAVKAKRNLRAWICKTALEQKFRMLDIVHVDNGEGAFATETPTNTQLETWDRQEPILHRP
jgi:predicted RNA-binding Zn-ribbon protein involved in translation (DUF1610 family)